MLSAVRPITAVGCLASTDVVRIKLISDRRELVLNKDEDKNKRICRVNN